MHSVMRALASLVNGLDEEDKIRRAVGEMGNGPYIHEFAAPVCAPNTQCHQIVVRNVQNLLASEFKKVTAKMAARLEEAEKTNQKRQEWQRASKREELGLGGSAKPLDKASGEWEYFDDDDHDNGVKLYTDGAEDSKLAQQIGAPDGLIKFRVSVFCGRPILDVNVPARKGRLTSLVFSSRWPASMSPVGKTHEQEYRDYRVVAAFHEQHILDAARFRCAICTDEEVPATTLLHHLISFKRDTTVGPQFKGIRETVAKLFQYVEGPWSAPEMTAALGADRRCHINDWVVPICNKNSNCEGIP
jgi:hypothetical protein